MNKSTLSAYETLSARLQAQPQSWLVTGAAGFIGSNLVERLLRLGQRVRGLDSFYTGYQRNLDEIRESVSSEEWSRFEFVEGDICVPEVCSGSCSGMDYVLHQAAMGSVPRSIEEPLNSFRINAGGTVNMLEAARTNKVKRFVYASSSAVYGDHPGLPKVEHEIGNQLSPYAATKLADELFANVFQRCYGLEVIGLRYFNVFGPRQDPDGAYAAVIPKWIDALLRRESVFINGDGSTSRDFCYVANVVQANLLAAAHAPASGTGQAYNVALNQRTTLKELYELLQTLLAEKNFSVADQKPVYREFRAGDILHSQADISHATTQLGFAPTHDLQAGLRCALPWYLAQTASTAK
jgi:UDP-N-acetylglucosamine 4-epimerase